MKIRILALAMVLFCTSCLALSEADKSISNSWSANNTTSSNQTGTISPNQTDESSIAFATVNLTSFGEDHPLNPETGISISQAASGNHASTNLVQMAPGSILKTHYHQYRDEVAYIIGGEAVFTFSDLNYTARAGDLVYIPAMVLHRVTVIGNETFQVVSTFAPPFDGKDRIFVEP